MNETPTIEKTAKVVELSKIDSFANSATQQNNPNSIFMPIYINRTSTTRRKEGISTNKAQEITMNTNGRATLPLTWRLHENHVALTVHQNIVVRAQTVRAELLE